MDKILIKRLHILSFIFLFSFIFSEDINREIPGDVNGDGLVDVVDIVYLVSFIGDGYVLETKRLIIQK